MRTLILFFSLGITGLLAQEEMMRQTRDQIYINGRKSEDLSKAELHCALYQLWRSQQRMTCFQAERQYKTKLDPHLCGEDLAAKADACEKIN